MIKNKKILVVAFYLYPCNLIGAKRSSYLANFLSNKGMDVTVLKADNENYFNNIDFNLSFNSNIKIVNVNNKKKMSYKESITWYFTFKKGIVKLLKKNDFDLLYFSGGPFFYFPLGSYFYRKYGVPYILDFRDIWVNRLKKKITWKGKIFQCFNKYLEKKSLNDAELIIHVTNSESNYYKQYYNQINRAKLKIIYNGFDEAVLEKNIQYKNLNKVEKKIHYNIGIFGKFSSYCSEHSLILINAIKELKKTVQITIYHVGIKEEDFIKLVMQNNLEKNFKFLGYKNYIEGMKIINNMDFLILNNRSEYALGTKIFDYLFLNKPILSFTTLNSEIWKLLYRFRNTYIIQNSEDFISAINYLKKNSDHSVIDEEDLLKFTRKYQMEYLYTQLQSCVRAKKSRHLNMEFVDYK
ncbi:glycosyltransferase [bacterium]|nr:glycosyltransferase [bacterium]